MSELECGEVRRQRERQAAAALGFAWGLGGTLVNHFFQLWGNIRAPKALRIYPSVLTSVLFALSIPLPLSTKKFKKIFFFFFGCHGLYFSLPLCLMLLFHCRLGPFPTPVVGL